MQQPTERSLKLLKKLGYEAQVVERWIPQTHQRKDLFGVIDVVAVNGPMTSILGVQATSAANQAARLTKALAEPKLRTWLEAGGKFQIWGWSKKGKRGARKLWKVRCQEVYLDRASPTGLSVRDVWEEMP